MNIFQHYSQFGPVGMRILNNSGPTLYLNNNKILSFKFFSFRNSNRNFFCERLIDSCSLPLEPRMYKGSTKYFGISLFKADYWWSIDIAWLRPFSVKQTSSQLFFTKIWPLTLLVKTITGSNLIEKALSVELFCSLNWDFGSPLIV